MLPAPYSSEPLRDALICLQVFSLHPPLWTLSHLMCLHTSAGTNESSLFVVGAASLSQPFSAASGWCM